MQLQVNDITINVELAGAGRSLLMLHGFTGSAASWAPHTPCFARHVRTIAPDLIGHGQSARPPDPERYRMERCVDDLLALLAALDVDRADVLGYSMGGRVALHLAAAAPGRVRLLVLESSSPGIADPSERQARIAADAALADAIERDGLESFVNRWERLPLFASQAALPAGTRARLRDQRLGNNPVGLANSLRGMGAGHQEPLWQRLAALHLPALLVVGALDAKYKAIAGSMIEALPNAQMQVIPAAGHTVHLEQPEAFARIVLEFLELT